MEKKVKETKKKDKTKQEKEKGKKRGREKKKHKNPGLEERCIFKKECVEPSIDHDQGDAHSYQPARSQVWVGLR